jgi:hypothetical protein
MNSARAKTIALGILALLLFIVIMTPNALLESYRARLVAAVPIGSTPIAYQEARAGDKLGFCISEVPELTFWQQLDFQGCSYTIMAYPEWDAFKRLKGATGLNQ